MIIIITVVIIILVMVIIIIIVTMIKFDFDYIDDQVHGANPSPLHHQWVIVNVLQLRVIFQILITLMITIIRILMIKRLAIDCDNYL